jgi:DNA replication and repair protein RecF
VIVERLELRDFRNFASASFRLDAGVTAIVGDNGQGKTNLAEALSFLATLESFRGVPPDALVRVGHDQAIVRAEIVHADGRRVLVEAEINKSGRNRVFVNRQRLVRSRDLLGVLRVTVFTPDDLALVKGGPQERRHFLDETLTALAVRNDGLRRDLERILRQRNTLLRQAGGRLTDDVAFTLDVWDAKLTDVGEQLGRARAVLVERMRPLLGTAYRQLAGTHVDVGVRYEPSWRTTGLAAALAAARADDVRRQQSSVGPHRDDLDLFVDGLPARTQASQGEQRTLSLALRLAVHSLIRDTVGDPPLLVLDDVLSELDPGRARALLTHLPAGQVVITTAAALPEAAHPDVVLRIHGGNVVDDRA